MKKRAFMTMLLSAASSAIVCAQNNLDNMEGKFHSLLEESACKTGLELTSIEDKYAKAVNRLRSQLAAKGDLEGVVAIDREIARLQTADTLAEPPPLDEVPAFKGIRDAYVKARETARLDGAKSIVAIGSRYERTLANLQSRLTREGKIEEALAVRKKRESAGQHPILAAARLTADNAASQEEARKAEAEAMASARTEKAGRKKAMNSLKEFAKTVQIVSAGYEAGSKVKIAIGDHVVYDEAPGTARGLNVVAVEDGEVVLKQTFDTHRSPEASQAFVDAVNAMKNGTFVVIAVSDEATSSFSKEAQKAIAALGGKKGLLGQPYRCSYYLIGRKGLNKGDALEDVGNDLLTYP